VRQPRVADPDTIADGLLTGIGEITFAVLSTLGARIVTVGEDEIVAAARFQLTRMKLVVEPSAATVLAALRRITGEIGGMRVGAVISGGNTDFRWLDTAALA
jgi:threonine dehydratase